MTGAKRKLGAALIVLGTLLLLGAVGLVVYNVLSDSAAGAAARDTIEALEAELPQEQVEWTEPLLPEQTYAPRTMPTVEIDGMPYIGCVAIPVLNIKLPVMARWSDELARIAPCRYRGEAYDGTLIIAGHNYRSHFGTLSSLYGGEAVVFTDMDGNVFNYVVTSVEIIDRYDVDGMLEGDWDMTVFTCTMGGQERVTVRCRLA